MSGMQIAFGPLDWTAPGQSTMELRVRGFQGLMIQSLSEEGDDSNPRRWKIKS
jgi:hypothetical protein